MLVIGMQDGDLGEFAYNFNFVTSHYYKDVDRKELLHKAFSVVLDELKDPYTQMLDEDFKNSMKNGDLNCQNNVSNTSKGDSYKNITTKMFEQNNKKIAYIKMQAFTLDSAKDFKKKLDKLNKEHYDGLIIDLRGNLGGENANLVDIASLFLDSSKVICIDKFKTTTKIYYSHGDKTANYPIAILGNIDSASCSEILICALQEGCNAKFIGTRTFGKNVAQICKETPNYYYKFTAAYWLTPSGKSIGKDGIKPDIEVYNVGDEDTQLKTAIEYLTNK